MTWFWYALIAAMLWGLGYTINQITLKYFSPIELLFFESILVLVIITIYFFIFGNFTVFITKLTNPKMLLLIIVSSLIYMVASILIFKSIAASNASLAAIIESCYPIFAVLFAYILFGQVQINLASAFGIILIIAGALVIKIYSP